MRTGSRMLKTARDRLPSEFAGHPAFGAGAGASAALGLYGLSYLLADREGRRRMRKSAWRDILLGLALGGGVGAAASKVYGPQPTDPDPVQYDKPGYFASKARMFRNAGRELRDKFKSGGESLAEYAGQYAEDTARKQLAAGKDPESPMARAEQLAPELAAAVPSTLLAARLLKLGPLAARALPFLFKTPAAAAAGSTAGAVGLGAAALGGGMYAGNAIGHAVGDYYTVKDGRTVNEYLGDSMPGTGMFLSNLGERFTNMLSGTGFHTNAEADKILGDYRARAGVKSGG